MIVYGSLTNTSIGKLFIAGIIPGILLIADVHGLHLRVQRCSPASVQREAKRCRSLDERLRLLMDLVPPAVVFGIVMGSLYFGHRDRDRIGGARRGGRAVLRLAGAQA